MYYNILRCTNWTHCGVNISDFRYIADIQIHWLQIHCGQHLGGSDMDHSHQRHGKEASLPPEMSEGLQTPGTSMPPWSRGSSRGASSPGWWAAPTHPPLHCLHCCLQGDVTAAWRLMQRGWGRAAFHRPSTFSTCTKLLQIHHLYLFVFIFIQTVFIFLQQVHKPFDCPLCHVWQLKTIWIWMYNRIFRSWGRRNRKSNAFRQMAEESKGPRLASSGDDHRKLQGHWSNG